MNTLQCYIICILPNLLHCCECLDSDSVFQQPQAIANMLPQTVHITSGTHHHAMQQTPVSSKVVRCSYLPHTPVTSRAAVTTFCWNTCPLQQSICYNNFHWLRPLSTLATNLPVRSKENGDKQTVPAQNISEPTLNTSFCVLWLPHAGLPLKQSFPLLLQSVIQEVICK